MRDQLWSHVCERRRHLLRGKSGMLSDADDSNKKNCGGAKSFSRPFKSMFSDTFLLFSEMCFPHISSGCAVNEDITQITSKFQKSAPKYTFLHLHINASDTRCESVFELQPLITLFLCFI